MDLFCNLFKLISCLLCISCFAFNLEDRIPIAKQGPKQSLFGLSVEQHYIKENPSSLSDVTLLVGAPKAAAASYQSSDLENPGALFKCSISSKKKCRRVQIVDDETTFEVNASNSWLGVTVKSQKPGGNIAVCAHRLTIRGGQANPRSVLWEAEVGRCYMLDNEVKKHDFEDSYQPCVGKLDAFGTYTKETYGYCQAGTSFVFGDNKAEDIAIGLPGTKLWSGDIFNFERAPDLFFPSSLYGSEGLQESLIEHNSYLGFSLAAGFNGHSQASEAPLFIAGAPRGGDIGQVVFFEKVTFQDNLLLNITNILSGEVLGSAFGYDLEVVDVNGDGLSDLVVGAPHYYNRIERVGGAVYIYVNKGPTKANLGPNASTILFGEPESSFGTSITTLGDINMDGFTDIAIGAPGADAGIGKVYIYHGSSTGIDKQPAQVISGQKLQLTNSITVNGFGYALSGGLDMDLNGYPDLAVGSLSDAAFLYRSRPVVNIRGNITATRQKININPDATFDFNVPIVNLSVCLDYQSVPLTFDEYVHVLYTIKLDVTKLDEDLQPRVSFSPSEATGIESSTLLLPPQSKNSKNCTRYSVYLNDNIQDKLSPFEFSLSYDVVNKEITGAGDVPSLNQYPISNQNVADTVFTRVNISKNCGEDEICESNLQMDAKYMVLLDGQTEWEPLPFDLDEDVPLLYAGTEREIGIKTDISNNGEDAHQAKLEVVFPEYLSFIGTIPQTVFCYLAVENNSLLICELGNPFRQENNISLTIRFANDERLYNTNQFSISVALNTSSEQVLKGFQSYAASVKVQAQIQIDGYAASDQIPFSGEVVGESAVTKPEDAGLYIYHEYEIKNTGKSEIGPVILSIDWPYAISNNKWLFYLLSYKVAGSFYRNDVVCSADYLDPLNINAKPKDSRSKREVETPSSSENLKADIKPASVRDPLSTNVELSCPDSARCTIIHCNLGTMTSQQKLFVNITGVVWNSTLNEEFNGTVQVRVSSTGSVYINRTNILYSSSSIRSDTIVTTLLSEDITIAEYHAEWWVIALATAAGVSLLIIIVLILWKCGFFKRKRESGDFHKAHRHRQAKKLMNLLTNLFTNYQFCFNMRSTHNITLLIARHF